MISEKDWIKATYQHCVDPTEWNGTNPSCKLCDKEIEYMDEYCEDHQACIMCGENDDCDCEEEWGNLSNCCEATFLPPGYPDNDICSACKEHSISAWEETEQICGITKTK
tara:strand:- start:736 stop:1065 length:330 start_codon:yes stop_codon:yes gene_type:complete